MKKKYINQDFFDKPLGRFSNNLCLKKFDFAHMEISCENPCIFLTPNISTIDKNLITKCIKTKFVFIQNNVVQRISEGTFDEKLKQNLLKEISLLAEIGYSFSIIWGKSTSIFGENEKLSDALCLFLKETKLDLKFLTFPNEFFAMPTWGTSPRKTKIFANQKLSIKAKSLIGLSTIDTVNVIQKTSPSSANSYTNKFPVNFASNNIAEGLEKVVYACPICKNLLSLYSEFSCLKCRDCGNVIEIDKNAKIHFSQNIQTFDELENFQFNQLKQHDFDIHKLIEYEKITQIISENCKKSIKIAKILQIYAEKIILINPVTKTKTTYLFEDMDDVIYSHNNTITLKQKNAKQIQFFGKSNENLLIIKDLIKINKN